MSGWPSVRIGDVCEFDPSKSRIRDLDGNTTVSFLPMNGLGIGGQPVSGQEERALSEVYRGYTYFADGDVLLAKITPCFENGKLGTVTELKNKVGFGSSEFMVLRPGPKVSAQYLALYLSQDEFRERGAKAMTGAVGHKRVPKEWVQNFRIPLPPLVEQQRIVARLNSAFEGISAAIAIAERNGSQAKSLLELVRDRMFVSDGAWHRIEHVCEAIVDCPNRTAPTVEGPTAFKMIRTTNVRNGQINLASTRYVAEATYQRWTRRQVPQRGDVLLTREAPMGEVGLIDFDDQVFLGQRIVSYRVNEGRMKPRFLLHVLQTKALQDQIREKASGSTVQHMRVPDTKTLLVPCPPPVQQSEIVATYESIKRELESLQEINRSKLRSLAELKQALLARAFSGGLTREPIAA